MSIENWWPKLATEDQDWLIQHNGEAIPADMLKKVSSVGGLVCSSTNIVGYPRPGGFQFTDETVDWIESVANGEVPTPK